MFRTALDKFFGWIARFEIKSLDDETFNRYSLLKPELHCGQKDTLLVAFAIRHGLTRFATMDSRIIGDGQTVRRICEEKGWHPTLRFENVDGDGN